MRINEFLVSGHVGQDAKEVMAGGKRLVTFSLAYSHGKDKATDWYTVKVWANPGREWLCDNAAGFRKGDYVVVRGRFEVRRFPKTDGAEGLALEITADWFSGLVKGAPKPSADVPRHVPADDPPAVDDIPF